MAAADHHVSRHVETGAAAATHTVTACGVRAAGCVCGVGGGVFGGPVALRMPGRGGGAVAGLPTTPPLYEEPVTDVLLVQGGCFSHAYTRRASPSRLLAAIPFTAPLTAGPRPPPPPSPHVSPAEMPAEELSSQLVVNLCGVGLQGRMFGKAVQDALGWGMGVDPNSQPQQFYSPA